MNVSTETLAENYTLSDAQAEDPVAAIINIIALYWQLIISCPAVLLNMVVFFTYLRVRNLFPASAQVILTHQTFMEFCSASFGLIWQMTKTIKPNIPNGVGGDIICNIWVDFYWCVTNAVQSNCVVVSLDRFFAVCFPMKRIMTRKRAFMAVLLVDFITFFVVIWQDSADTRHNEDTGYCFKIPVQRDFMLALGVVQLVLFGLSPFFAVIFYIPMILTIKESGRRMKSATSGGGDSVRNAATSRLVRTCMVATICLTISNVPDIVFYYFYYCIFDMKTLPMASFEESVNTMFTTVYPFVSPIIYSFSTSRFRQAAFTAFGCSYFFKK